MIIVFQSINIFSIIPACIIGLFTNVYYLSSPKIFLSNFFLKKLTHFFNLRLLSSYKKRKFGSIRDYDYGFESTIHNHANNTLPTKLTNNLGGYFKNIAQLEKKLRLAVVSLTKYHDLGEVAFFLKGEVAYENIYFIHTSILSYILRSNGVRNADKFNHLLIPSEELQKILNKIKTLLTKLFFIFKKNSAADYKEIKNSSKKTTAILFDQVINSTNLFTKQHYFSDNPKSKLNPKKVLCLILNRQKIAQQEALDNKLILIDIYKIYKLGNFLSIFSLFCSEIKHIKSTKELPGLFLLLKFYLSYLGWKNFLIKYPDIKNIIYDYDITLDKLLSLAIESLNIKSLALQERGSSSFGSAYGVISDTFFYSGRLYMEYGNKNKSFICKEEIAFGQWRTALFYSKHLPNFYSLNFKNLSDKTIHDFDSVICCLGLFISEENSFSLYGNPAAIENFLLQIKEAALTFINHAFILRMKILGNNDRLFIINYFSGVNNFFICDDYSRFNISYTLCKKADIILSLQTSLAEESIAVGKKVIMLNSTYNCKSICKEIYPDDFHFLISDDSRSTIDLISRCIHNDPNLNRKYQDLKIKLGGNFDLSVKNIIPDTFENYLQ